MPSAPFPCPDCCTRQCSHCIDGEAPNKFQVVISGLTEASSLPCDDCSIFDGTYVLDFVSNCIYRNLDGVNENCEFFRMELRMEFPTTMTVDLNIGGVVISYIKAFGADIDCKNLSSEDIPWDNDPDEQCTGSSSTCKVTSL